MQRKHNKNCWEKIIFGIRWDRLKEKTNRVQQGSLTFQSSLMQMNEMVVCWQLPWQRWPDVPSTERRRRRSPRPPEHACQWWRRWASLRRDGARGPIRRFRCDRRWQNVRKGQQLQEQTSSASSSKPPSSRRSETSDQTCSGDCATLERRDGALGAFKSSFHYLNSN